MHLNHLEALGINQLSHLLVTHEPAVQECRISLAPASDLGTGTEFAGFDR
jgi:hypothetical protein